MTTRKTEPKPLLDRCTPAGFYDAAGLPIEERAQARGYTKIVRLDKKTGKTQRVSFTGTIARTYLDHADRPVVELREFKTEALRSFRPDDVRINHRLGRTARIARRLAEQGGAPTPTAPKVAKGRRPRATADSASKAPNGSDPGRSSKAGGGVHQHNVGGFAGCVAERTVKGTGIVRLFIAQQADLDADGGNWVTVCEKHQTLVNHSSRKIAFGFLSHPDQWCEECGESS